MQGFLEFVRTQGVVGLAVGFILGGAVSKVVSSVVSDLINPILGMLLGSVEGLKTMTLVIGSAEIMVGNFISTLIDFLVVAAVVYFGVKKLGLENVDQKK